MMLMAKKMAGSFEFECTPKEILLKISFTTSWTSTFFELSEDTSLYFYEVYHYNFLAIPFQLKQLSPSNADHAYPTLEETICS